MLHHLVLVCTCANILNLNKNSLHQQRLVARTERQKIFTSIWINQIIKVIASGFVLLHWLKHNGMQGCKMKCETQLMPKLHCLERAIKSECCQKTTDKFIILMFLNIYQTLTLQADICHLCFHRHNFWYSTPLASKVHCSINGLENSSSL